MSPKSIIIASILLTVAVKLSISAPVVKATTTQVITYEQFLGIPIGWTREQITQYLNNNPGVVMSDTQYADTNVQIIQYTNTNPIGVAMFILTNNQLTTKSQSGLNQNIYPISFKQFNDITTGMSSAAVASLVGNAGQILGQTIDSIQIVGYTGSTNSYAVAQITFLKDEVMSKFEFGLYDEA